jgi:hypothetical protein
MRILSNGPGGKLILNPPSIVQLVKDSPMKNAALVIRGNDAVVSTGYTCHNDMMDAAGIVETPYVLDAKNITEATFRGGINEYGIIFHIWNKNNAYEIGDHVCALQAAYDFLSQHRRLRRAPNVEIAVFDDDYVVTHHFSNMGLTDVSRPSIGM